MTDGQPPLLSQDTPRWRLIGPGLIAAATGVRL